MNDLSDGCDGVDFQDDKLVFAQTLHRFFSHGVVLLGDFVDFGRFVLADGAIRNSSPQQIHAALFAKS
jgi:hypothetical protein